MSGQNNALFVNILKNSGPDFKYREELIQLHSKSLQLQSSINLRRQIELQYNNLKLEEVKERIDEMKFQKKFFVKRNNDILNDIQKRKLKNIEKAANTKEIYLNIEQKKKRYGDYIDSLIPKIQTEFNIQLLKENNRLAIERVKELKKLEKLQYKNNYYEKMTKENEKLANDIKNLKMKNIEAVEKYKQRENNYLESQKNLQNQIDNFKIDKEYYKQNQNGDSKKINDFKELSDLNKLKLKKDPLNSEDSLQDLRKQIFNVQKGIPPGTLYQNFEKPKLIDYNNNNLNININNNQKIEGDIAPNKNINNDINNNNKLGINNNIQNEVSNFNLLNSKKINDNNFNNINNNMSTNTNNNISDVNYVNINNISNNIKNNNNIKQEEEKINSSQNSGGNEFEGCEEVEV